MITISRVLARQWRALEGRLEQNYARMRENGMTIATEVPAELRLRLREAAKASIDEWASKAPSNIRATSMLLEN